MRRLELFEQLARSAHQSTDASYESEAQEHPFDARNIHPKLSSVAKKLFDDGHYVQATFEAFKFLDNEIKLHSGLKSKTGYALMMDAFNEAAPKITLTGLTTSSEKDEQTGYKFLFAGGMMAIRNPRGHEHALKDDPNLCLDHLGFVSMLLRRLSDAGYR